MPSSSTRNQTLGTTLKRKRRESHWSEKDIGQLISSATLKMWIRFRFFAKGLQQWLILKSFVYVGTILKEISALHSETSGDLSCWWMHCSHNHYFRDEKEFFDVTIACEDEQLQAHKVILSACSPFFRSVLRLRQCIAMWVSILKLISFIIWNNYEGVDQKVLFTSNGQEL